MALDPYQPCPCGSGKKLKFCCNELSADIERIHRQLVGDQPHAALRHVDAVLARHPGRTPLLDLKAIIQLSLRDVESAEQATKSILDREPNSLTGNALQAMIHAARHELREAVDRLQTALEGIDDEVPQRVCEAVVGVAQMLLVEGEILSARGHLYLYNEMTGWTDEHSKKTFTRLTTMAGLPLPLRVPRPLLTLPADHPAAEVMLNIGRLAVRGTWRKAAAACDEVLPDHLDVPLFFYNRALLSGYLGDTKNMVAGLRLYARQNIPFEDAVEAEAFARLLDESIHEPRILANRVTFDVTDEDACFKSLGDSKLMVGYEVDREEFGDGPKPRAMFLLLDREPPALDDNLKPADIPMIVGIASLYGRQTDRESRLELTTDNDDQFAANVAALAATCGASIASDPLIEHAGESASDDPVLSWRWHFPKDMPTGQKRALSAQERRRRLLEVWPDRPRVTLAGKTPREAARDELLRLSVAADVFVLEQSAKSPDDLPFFNQLREELGLPLLGLVDASITEPGDVNTCRMHRLDVSPHNDGQIFAWFRQASASNAVMAMRHTGRELLARRSDNLDADIFEFLFSAEDDVEAALEILMQARGWAVDNNQSCARWDMLELQFLLFENLADDAQRVLDHLRLEHAREPEVMQQLYQMMVMLGFVDPPEPAYGRPDDFDDELPSLSSAGNEIWTPAGATGGDASQKLWLPG